MRCLNFVVVFCLLLASDGFGQSPYHYKRDVEGVGQEGWYALPLPPDIFKSLNRDLSDLRLYALHRGDTAELPYLLRIHSPALSRSRVSLPVINESTRDGDLYLTFELQNQQQVNAIDLEFDQHNFFAFATIEGSADKKKWFTITREQRIVSIQNASDDYVLSTVSFPVTDYRYLRIRMKSDTPLTFRRAAFDHREVTPGRLEKIPILWTIRTDQKTKQSVVDIKFRHAVPVSSLHIQAGNTSDYYRSFQLAYVSDSTHTEKGWIPYYETLTQDYITSFTPGEFNFDWKRAKVLRLTIDNHDNAPLNIQHIEAEGPLVELISFLKPGKNILLYGNDRAEKASYDLEHFEKNIPDDVLGASFGSAEGIHSPGPGIQPLFESKAWLWSIMAVMMIGLGFFTIKMMKNKQ